MNVVPGDAAGAAPRGVQEALEDLDRGRFDPVKVTEDCLRRIDEMDGLIRAFSWVDAEGALATAHERGRQLADGVRVGPLHGLPIAVKELIDVASAPSEYGSQARAGQFADTDAAVVTRLRAAGAVVVGTTRSHEFGWGITTQHPVRGGTRNPVASDRVPGGSSGGAAAAVAAGMVPACVATDTGGSIRIPSAFCGVAGIKPTFGSVPRAGVVPLAPSLDTVGVIARHVGDLWPVLAVMQGVDPRASDQSRPRCRESLSGVSIGVAPRLVSGVSDGWRSACYDNALDVCAQLGAQLTEVDTPAAEDIRAVFTLIQGFEAMRTHTLTLALYPEHKDRYGADVAARLEWASGITQHEYEMARREGEQLRAQLVEASRTVDACLTPVSLVAPPMLDSPDTVQVRGQTVLTRDAVMGFTVPQNLAGLPAVAFPGALAEDGLPFGLQLTGAPGRDTAVLCIAGLLEGPISQEVHALPLPRRS